MRPFDHATPAQRDERANLLSTPNEQLNSLELSDELDFLSDAVHRFSAGGLYLYAGAPGGGKSTLSLQTGLDLGRRGVPSLFILTEQSAASVKARAQQMLSEQLRDEADRAMSMISVEPNVRDITMLPTFAMHEVLHPSGKYHGVKLIVLDSIQGEGLASAATKAYSKVLEFGRMCTREGITVILVSHVTKRGEIAGPKTLEHGVDVSLVLRKAMMYTLLSVRKNRFGPTQLRGIPLMMEPSTTRFVKALHAHAQPSAANTYGGATIGIRQVQVAISVPPDGQRAKVTAPGLPRKEIDQLIGCINQIEGLDLSELDHRIQCRMPRSGQYLTYFSLPLCMAMISSYARLPIPQNHLYLGEIDLFRKVLDVPLDVLTDLIATIDNAEIATPLKVFAPPSAEAYLSDAREGVKVISCSTLEDAIGQTWPNLR
ncbi:MAG: AAA family ATPase [Phycisphaeraceae bacterium]